MSLLPPSRSSGWQGPRLGLWRGGADVTCRIFKIRQFCMSLYLGDQECRLSLMTNTPEGVDGGGGVSKSIVDFRKLPCPMLLLCLNPLSHITKA